MQPKLENLSIVTYFLFIELISLGFGKYVSLFPRQPKQTGGKSPYKDPNCNANFLFIFAYLSHRFFSILTSVMLAKIAGLFACNYLFWRVITPPHHLAEKKGDKKENELTSKKIVLEGSIIQFQLTLFLSSCLYMYLCLNEGDNELFGIHFPKIKPGLNDMELLGLVLLILGAMLRLWAYSTLDKYFTFEIGIRKGHKLVTTGPYTLIRHPSYTGLLIVKLGLYLFPFSTVLDPIFYAITGFRAASASVFLPGLIIMFLRIPNEEKMLSEHFGEEWEKFASQRQRLIPFLF